MSTGILIRKPRFWFRSIHEARFDPHMQHEPESIEYLNMWTGEVFIHTGGTTYWGWGNERCLNIDALNTSGVTHYRVLILGES